jgi:FkbM family methyltransferase
MRNFCALTYAKGDVYIDVGANIGSTVIPACQSVGTSGVVMAFEAHPRTFRFLEDNLRLNRISGITLVNCALGAQPGNVRFSSLRSDDQNKVLLSGDGVLVPEYPMDRFIGEVKVVDLMKIDVEGYEKQVLEGAATTLRKTRCLYIEVSEPHFRGFGYSVDDLFVILHSAGLKPFLRIADERIAPVDARYFATVHDANVLAIREPGDFLARTGWSLA